jgi:beta-lactamase superfamily II metal-dependent hydrolase
MKKYLAAFILLLCLTSVAFGQANGKLQIHFMDVGQGDAAVLISPKGETVLFDNGVAGYCNLPVSYLKQIGITKIDYHIASHYHADHIGCTPQVLKAFPLKNTAYDRGGSYPSSANGVFAKYIKAVGTMRKTAAPGEEFTLDAGTASPVRILFVASNGNGINTTNENDLSLVAVVHFGNFDVEMGGDLSGFNTGEYKDIETGIAGKVNQVEVYKVHHHCSSYSSNDPWLTTIKPKIGIISASSKTGKNYNHPTEECVERLHKAGILTYWTEQGTGAKAEPGYDIVGKNIIVEAVANKDEFTVKYSGSHTDTYPLWESVSSTTPTQESYAWSKKSKVYHHSDCLYVSNISPTNLEKGNSPPSGKTLHKGCPVR